MSDRLSLDLTEGITEFSSRMSLKMMFAQFGEVQACWIPPLENRGREPAYVKFLKHEAAQVALDACKAGQIFLDGVQVSADWRTTPSRVQDSRDFDAKGSNLFSSRDLIQAQGGPHRDKDGDRKKGRDKKRSRSRSRGRKRSDSRSRRKSRSRGRKKSRSRGKKKSRSPAVSVVSIASS
mmetsp:Transcript_46675/g.99660  ORF Transcript_46675/g.99660 Transcript_46675/m.99660 type:complete len:179 (+) Transcript_46675:143-679(+)